MNREKTKDKDGRKDIERSFCLKLSKQEATRNPNLKRRRIDRHLSPLFSLPDSHCQRHSLYASKQSIVLHRHLHFFMASLTGFVAAVIIGLMFAGESIGRELRPSEHGLVFQNSPPAWLNYSSGMRSFFNSSVASNSSDMMTIPKAMNYSDSSPSSWWRSTGGGGQRNHVGVALVVASVVCGATGVILLVATGLLYLSKHRKHQVRESCGDNNNDKLQLAVSST